MIKLKLTKTGFDIFSKYKLETGYTASHDFCYLYNCKDDPCHAIAHQVIGTDDNGDDILQGYPESFKCRGCDDCQIDFHHHYNCNFGEEMEVEDLFYYSNNDLQKFVDLNYLEII